MIFRINLSIHVIEYIPCTRHWSHVLSKETMSFTHEDDSLDVMYKGVFHRVDDRVLEPVNDSQTGAAEAKGCGLEGGWQREGAQAEHSPRECLELGGRVMSGK